MENVLQLIPFHFKKYNGFVLKPKNIRATPPFLSNAQLRHVPVRCTSRPWLAL